MVFRLYNFHNQPKGVVFPKPEGKGFDSQGAKRGRGRGDRPPISGPRSPRGHARPPRGAEGPAPPAAGAAGSPGTRLAEKLSPRKEGPPPKKP